MEIVFTGLGPKDTVAHETRIYHNGSVVAMPEERATAYIAANLAQPITTEADREEARAMQKLEVKNAARRKAIETKSGDEQ